MKIFLLQAPSRFTSFVEVLALRHFETNLLLFPLFLTRIVHDIKTVIITQLFIKIHLSIKQGIVRLLLTLKDLYNYKQTYHHGPITIFTFTVRF